MSNTYEMELKLRKIILSKIIEYDAYNSIRDFEADDCLPTQFH
jgi:hypothetical protein